MRGLGAALLLAVAPARGQAPPAAADPLPPATPDLAPLPDLGVDWPDPARIDAEAGPGPASAEPAAQLERVPHYRVALEGAEPLGEAFRLRFDQLSTLVTDEGKPANAAQLERRQRQDEALARELMRAQGYYDGQASSTVGRAATPGPVTVRISLEPGTRYRFTAVGLPGLDAAGSAAAALQRSFAVKPGDPVDADAVLAAIASLKVELGRMGFPFARVADPQVEVDHAAHDATLALPITPGARARFGHIRIEGRPLFSERHLETIARFHPGQPFDAQRLDDLRRALIQTGLVSTATITPVATMDPGVVDVSVRIDRAPPRTISAELGYGTGQGARVALSWEHRNLLPPEGAVTFSGVGGTREQSLGATLRRGNFEARDRVLTAQVVANHSDFDAYDARTFTMGASVERQTNIIWQKKWVWSAGAEFVATNERDRAIDTGLNQRRTFLVAALPASLAYDGTDDLLNPSRGYRLAGRVSPEISLHDGTTLYVKAQVDASAYQPIAGWIVLAGRVRLATIEGAARNDIAPSRRLYSGGGGSIRGFGYQKVGPLAVDGTPVGGRGLTEFGTEARFRFGNFGVVPFLDWGTLTTSSTPSFSGFRFGTGLGVRYYSSFGPIRLDVGTPVNRRHGDSRVALYVSLGQAF